MRVGLLECDHVDERYRAIAGDYSDMFAVLLPALDLVRYDAIGGELPKEPDECDGWLLTGSRCSAYDDEPWIAALSSFVRELHTADAPTVGICFGHQLLAHALGGRVERASAGWGVGPHTIATVGGDRWPLLFMHQDQVLELPPDATVVGSTDHCPIAMLQIGSSMLGMQAHPEFTADYERALLDARAERIGVDLVQRARDELDGWTLPADVVPALTEHLRGAR